MISRYLNHFRQLPGSVVFEPAVDANLTKIDAELTARNFSAIPGEYRNFLKLNDGLIFNGMNFTAQSLITVKKGTTLFRTS